MGGVFHVRESVCLVEVLQSNAVIHELVELAPKELLLSYVLSTFSPIRYSTRN